MPLARLPRIVAALILPSLDSDGPGWDEQPPGRRGDLDIQIIYSVAAGTSRGPAGAARNWRATP